MFDAGYNKILVAHALPSFVSSIHFISSFYFVLFTARTFFENRDRSRILGP